MTTPKMPDLNEGGQRTLESFRHLVDAHSSRLDGHDQRLEGHDGRLDGHDASIAEHHDRISALEKAAGASGDGHDGDA